MKKSRWLLLMDQLCLPPSVEIYQQLWSAYQEPSRHYHTNAHITQCLQQLDQAHRLAQFPAEVELALWFHDAVYVPQAQDNELKSAAWAMQFLQQVSPSEADPARLPRIYAHILATQHPSDPPTGDTAIVVDIDLSILGSAPRVFDRFEKNIRAEYEWVPLAMYRQKRCAVLSSFLAHTSIYKTEYFQDLYESAARRNLMTMIEKLKD